MARPGRPRYDRWLSPREGARAAIRDKPLPQPLFAAAFLLIQASAPEQFFAGHTEGEGRASVILSGSHGVRTHSRGHMERGALVIDQIVEEEGKPARRRTWRLVRSGANGIAGTLTDADGPVTGDVAGDRLHLAYRSSEGPYVEQWITMEPNGRAARNHMTFRRFGLNVATLEEVIRRAD